MLRGEIRVRSVAPLHSEKIVCYTSMYMWRETFLPTHQENDEIRCASIYLMGNLSKFGSGEQVFKDQIHNVLVSLLLHLVDPNPHVVKVQSSITGILVCHTTISNSASPLNVPRRASMPCEFVPLWWDRSRLQPCFRTTSTMTSPYITESLSTTSPSTW